MRRAAIVLLTVAALIAAPAHVIAKTVSAGSIGTTPKSWSVIPVDKGYVSFTLTWQKKVTVALVAVSGDGKVVWCSSIARTLRTIRCDFTTTGRGGTVVVGIATRSGSTKFHLNVDGPVDSRLFKSSDLAPAGLDAKLEQLLQ